MLIVGPPGSGKSHLAAMFSHKAQARTLRREDLSNTDLDPLITHSAFVLDDADKKGEEAPFFHLLNLVNERGATLLMTARTAPSSWGVATRDLLSRLRLAPIVEIAPPDPALMEAVLLKLFSDRQIHVEVSLLSYIANRLDRDLDRARTLVADLDAQTLARGGKITRALANRLMNIPYE